MNPTFDLKSEHDTMAIILTALKKTASDIHQNNYFDLFRASQIIEFIRTYNDKCHHEKEERILFPAILESGLTNAADTVRILISEHEMARDCIAALENNIRDYLAGHTYALEGLSPNINKYISLEEKHIKTENNVLFPMADKVLNTKKQETILIEFRHIQDQNVGHNKHLEYYILLSKLHSEANASCICDFSY